MKISRFECTFLFDFINLESETHTIYQTGFYDTWFQGSGASFCLHWGAKMPDCYQYLNMLVSGGLGGGLLLQVHIFSEFTSFSRKASISAG